MHDLPDAGSDSLHDEVAHVVVLHVLLKAGDQERGVLLGGKQTINNYLTKGLEREATGQSLTALEQSERWLRAHEFVSLTGGTFQFCSLP